MKKHSDPAASAAGDCRGGAHPLQRCRRRGDFRHGGLIGNQIGYGSDERVRVSNGRVADRA